MTRAMPGIRSTDGSRHRRAHARTWERLAGIGEGAQGEGDAAAMTMLAGMPLTFWLLVIVILFALGALLGFLLALEMWEPLVPFVEKTFLRFWARTKDCFARFARK